MARAWFFVVRGGAIEGSMGQAKQEHDAVCLVRSRVDLTSQKKENGNEHESGNEQKPPIHLEADPAEPKGDEDAGDVLHAADGAVVAGDVHDADGGVGHGADREHAAVAVARS